MKLKLITNIIILALLTSASLALFTRTPQFGRLYYPYRYREIIESQARRYDIDPLLVAAIIRVESKFHPDAVSRKGAIGLMQIMPSTAEWIAAQLDISDFSADMLFDPEINIRFGSWYLSSLAKEFDARLDVVIASYNGGRGHVSSWLQQGTWSGRYEDRRDIPFSETRLFLFKVYNAYNSYTTLYAN
ncbi:MAG: lytic transglycosylase domain-containing protein [Dethiobacter sp.]|jgi:soluble lytic murein transglycosylase|nr:lytic transglycosylase domain-containing protein [Dethiobacter sp.]